MSRTRLRPALSAAGWHLLISGLVAAIAAGLVFGVWFPYPYRELVGGRELFLIVVSVDVVCGPLLTFVLFNNLKSRRELTLDLSLVALIQLAALLYGLHTVMQARPVYLVFEVDRFRAVTMADVQHEKLRPELGGLHMIGWGGPKVIGVRAPKDTDEMLRSLDLSLSGIDPSARPDWWVPYEDVRIRVLTKARMVSELRKKHPQQKILIDAILAESVQGEDGLRWLPITSFKTTGWVAFVDATTGDVKSFAPLDGF